MSRRIVQRLRRMIVHPVTLTLAILLMAVSALSGNVFQNADRSSLRQDNRELKAQNAGLRHQLDLVKGEQECRSRIASESELYSGQLLVALGQLVPAIRAGDDHASDLAEDALRLATVALEPSLDVRRDAVEICAADPDYLPGAPPTATTSTSSTSTTVPALAQRTIPTRARPPASTRTTTPAATTTTTTTTSPGCEVLPGLTLLEGFRCP